MKYWENAWSNYLLTSLFKYCNQGDSDLKNATSEIILTSNKVSLLKWERPAGDGKNQAGEFFFHHLTFFPPDMVQLSKKKKLFHLINALHYPIWHQHCRKVTIWGNPSLFYLPIKRQIIHSLKRLSTSSYSWYYWSCQILVYSTTIMNSRKSILTPSQNKKDRKIF